MIQEQDELLRQAHKKTPEVEIEGMTEYSLRNRSVAKRDFKN